MDASNLVNFLYVFVVVINGRFQVSYGFIEMVVERVSVMVELRIIG